MLNKLQRLMQIVGISNTQSAKPEHKRIVDDNDASEMIKGWDRLKRSDYYDDFLRYAKENNLDDSFLSMKRFAFFERVKEWKSKREGLTVGYAFGIDIETMTSDELRYVISAMSIQAEDYSKRTTDFLRRTLK